MTEDFDNLLYSKELKHAYDTETNKAMREIENEFNKNREHLIKTLKNSIDSERQHRDILNSCVYPFTERGSMSSSQYKFVRGSPLAELGLANMDFLLYKKHDKLPVAILGECKGSVSRISSVVEETRKRLKVAEDNIATIKESYLHLPPENDLLLECVLAVPSGTSDEAIGKVIDTGGGIIVWKAALTGDPEISIAHPPRFTHAMNMMHRDKGLNVGLKNAPSNRRFLSVFPQSHPYLELTSIIRAAWPGDSGLVLTEDEVRLALSKDLFYMEDSYVRQKSAEILSSGVSIGFMEWSPKEGAYRIVARGNNRGQLELRLEDKWIDDHIRRQLEQRKSEESESIKEKYRKEITKQKRVPNGWK